MLEAEFRENRPFRYPSEYECYDLEEQRLRKMKRTKKELQVMNKQFDEEDYEKQKQERRNKFIEKDGQEKNQEVMEVRRNRQRYTDCERAIVDAVKAYKVEFDKRLKLQDTPGERSTD